MNKKLFISTAGIGSRVSGLGVVPNKSLLPINYEAIITKIGIENMIMIVFPNLRNFVSFRKNNPKKKKNNHPG